MDLRGHYRWATWSHLEDFLSDWEELRTLCSNCLYPTAAEIASWAADESLFQSATPQRTSLLLSLLALPDSAIRQATFIILEQLDFEDDDTLAQVLDIVTAFSSEAVRGDCYDFLMSSSPIIVTRGLVSKDERKRNELLQFVTAGSAQSACGVLADWYRNGDESLRFAVAESLGQLQARGTEAVSQLLEIATNQAESIDVKLEALYSLAVHYPDAEEVLSRIGSTLFSKGDHRDCTRVAAVLGKFGLPKPLHPLLLRLFDFNSGELRAAVLNVLGDGSSTQSDEEVRERLIESHDELNADLVSAKLPKHRASGPSLLAQYSEFLTDDSVALLTGRVALQLAPNDSEIVDTVIGGTIARPGFLQELGRDLPRSAWSELFQSPDTNRRLARRFEANPSFVADVIAHGNGFEESTLRSFRQIGGLHKTIVPELLRVAGGFDVNHAALRLAFEVFDDEGFDFDAGQDID